MAKKQKDSKKMLENLEEAVNKDLEKMLKMKFTDFKVETVDHAKQLYGILFKLVERIVENQKDLKGCLKVIIDNLYERDRLLGNVFRDNRIENIAGTVFMLVCKAIGGQISRKDREVISDALGRKWTDDNEALFINAAMVQGSS